MLLTQQAKTGAKPANYPWIHTNLAPPGCARDSGSSCWCGSQISWDECVFDLGPASIIHIDPGFINPKAVSLGSCVSNSRFSGIAPQLNIYLLFIPAWYEHDFLQPVDCPLTLRDDYHRTVLHFWELIATIVAIRDSVSSIFFCATATNTDWKSINTRPFPRSQRQNDLTSRNFHRFSRHCSKVMCPCSICRSSAEKSSSLMVDLIAGLISMETLWRPNSKVCYTWSFDTCLCVCVAWADLICMTCLTL